MATASFSSIPNSDGTNPSSASATESTNAPARRSEFDNDDCLFVNASSTASFSVDNLLEAAMTSTVLVKEKCQSSCGQTVCLDLRKGLRTCAFRGGKHWHGDHRDRR